MTAWLRSGLACLALLGASCASPPPPRSEPTSLLGQRLPPFEAQTLSGKTVSSASFGGHPVVLAFVRTDCEPCEQLLEDVQGVFRGNERTVAWAVFSPDDPARVKKLAAKLALEYPVVMDDGGRFARLFVVSSQPTTVVLDSLGYVRWMGREIGEAELARIVREAE